MEDKRFWVKVSGLERASRQGAPYADAVPFARKLVAEFGDRVVWGSDWPHPNLEAIPDDGMLVDLIGEFANEAQRQALLVDNPQQALQVHAHETRSAPASRAVLAGARWPSPTRASRCA